MSDRMTKKPTWQDVLDLSVIDPVVNMVMVAYRNESKEDKLIRMVIALSQSREDLIKRWVKEKMEQVIFTIKVNPEV